MKPGSGFVNVTSTFAMIGGWRGEAYSAAKGGLKSLTEHMACEYGPQGIRSNCVAPGVTMTDMVRHRFEDETFRRTHVDTTPYPRLAEPEDIASVIAFLCSPGGEMVNPSRSWPMAAGRARISQPARNDLAMDRSRGVRTTGAGRSRPRNPAAGRNWHYSEFLAEQRSAS